MSRARPGRPAPLLPWLRGAARTPLSPDVRRARGLGRYGNGPPAIGPAETMGANGL